MSEFKLSASLAGHEDDVRSVAFPNSETMFSASRDATVRIWRLLSKNPPKYDGSIASTGNTFINTVAYIPPSSDYPEGLVVSGGKDAIIEVREPNKPPDSNAERLLLGHAHNVCALDISPDAKWLVSGSWDGTARVWSTGKWDCEVVLEDHQGSVWSVLAFDTDTIITACADTHIRVFSKGGKLLQTIRGHSDPVRALCKLPKGHPTGADFASASNDGTIRLWELRGRQVGELHGHESFVYCLAGCPNGDLVSCGEDRTVRVWRGNQCIQTITHPAISVWSVSVCPENGDIASGASDKVLRVFTRSPERVADAETLQAFEESVQSSAIPQQQVGEINKEQLPGPSFLTSKSGTKEGQVQMIRQPDGSVSAHTWSTAAQQWVNVGTVVDAAGSSGRRTDYLGKDYDYVFDVDIEDGKPALKLPYNLSQNPYEAAKKFIDDNELPIGYLDQVANFITENTRGATLGQSQNAPTGPDPLGTEQRYRPGDDQQVAPSRPPPAGRPKVLPQTQYLSIRTANLKTIHKKIEELNNQLISESEKDFALNPEQISVLQALVSELEKSTSEIPASNPTVNSGLELVMQISMNWPPANRLPALDLLRLLAAATPATATLKSYEGSGLIELFEQSGVFADPERPNNIMLATRALANLFETEKGRALADDKFDKIHELVSSSSKGTSNRNLTIAVTTLYINYAVLVTSSTHKDLPSSLDRALLLLGDLTAILGAEKDSEAIYRALVAIGTLLGLGEDVQIAAKEICDVESVLRKAESGVKEPRVKGVVGEIRVLLK